MVLEDIKLKLVCIQNWLTIRLVVLGFLRKSRSKFIRVGTPYGGWYLPETRLNRAEDNTLISVGIGFDVSFDLELANSGFNVILVDPLPESIRFARQKLEFYSNCFFENSGLSSSTGTQIFYSPKNPDHDSWSSTNVQSTDAKLAKYFPVLTLTYLVSKYEYLLRNHFVYLKMDIEGEEINQISEICKLASVFDFIGIEFDFLSLIPFWQFSRRVRSIKLARKLLKEMDEAGYRMICVDHYNLHWERDDDNF